MWTKVCIDDDLCMTIGYLDYINMTNGFSLPGRRIV